MISTSPTVSRTSNNFGMVRSASVHSRLPGLWADLGVELDEIVSTHCETQNLIDGALKSYLTFTSSFTGMLACFPVARLVPGMGGILGSLLIRGGGGLYR